VVEGFVRLVRENVPLVEDNDKALARLADFGNDAVILDFEPAGAIDHKHGKVGTADAFQGAHVAEDLDFVFDLRLLAQARSIGHHELLTIDNEVAVNGIACRARNVGDHRAVFVQQAVQQRALARIRAAEDSKADGARFLAFPAHGRRENGYDFVEKRKAGITRKGTDRAGLAKTEFQEFIAFLAVALLLALVRHKNHLLVELADKARKLLVEFGNAHADIHHKEHQVGLFDGVKNLRANAISQNVDGIVRQESAGIDHRKFVALVVRGLVMPVAGYAITVRDNGSTTPQNTIKERGLPHVRAPDYTYDW